MLISADPARTKRIIEEFKRKGEPEVGLCGCLGPQELSFACHPPKLGPFCPCMMKWVVTDDNEFFLIRKRFNGEAYTYEPDYVGPVGGPYVLNTMGAPAEKARAFDVVS